MGYKIEDLLRSLTGKKPPFPGDWDELVDTLFSNDGMGYSQFNELMLLFGYDRISHSLFQYICDGETVFKPGTRILNKETLKIGIDRFIKIAILLYGNIRYAFNWLNQIDESEFRKNIDKTLPYSESEYRARHLPLLPVQPIAGEDTYYLGYIVASEIEQKLKINPSDISAQDDKTKLIEVIERGKRNQQAYLASDHIDVYVATSMRHRHEYIEINRIVRTVFEPLKHFNLRYFDPTQAYCSERIDKGLAEALMLKRAECTLYLAQEQDTLGKDSELASTLAQGKTVIAYIPEIKIENELDYVEDLISTLQLSYPDRSINKIILEQLELYSSTLAWKDNDVKLWVADDSSVDVPLAKKKLATAIRYHYDKRANILKRDHPLGIQVDLNTGIANGVLVARTPEQCTELIRRIITNTLEFVVKEVLSEGRKYLYLEEVTTNSVYRVVTGDDFLTNVFWNFYLIE